MLYISSWWRKIQKVGLSSEYKEAESEIGKWMKGLFGIAFLNRDEVAGCFVEDFMSVCYDDKRVVEFADYLTDESMFPPILWLQVPSDSKRTNNGPESFHAHYNEQFYSSHPAIYIFIDNIIKFQTTTYIKMRSIDEVAPRSRLEKEKEQSLVSLYEQYCIEQISSFKSTLCQHS
jgi:hypothetical protein